MALLKDYSYLVGKKYNKLEVIEILPREPKKHAKCLCRCGCGTLKVLEVNCVICGKTQSCGCVREDTPYIVKKLNAKYECPCTIQECMRSSICNICCRECDKYSQCCMACKNTPEKCGAKKRR